MNLKYLTDKSLLLDTKNLAQQYRSVTTKLLHHLKEIDSRKLYSELGYSSLFTYVVQELGFSESSASRRIDAMKILREIPEIEQKIENGDLTLSNLGKAANVFKKEKVTDVKFKKEILNTIENTSARTCEKTLSEIIVPTSIPIPPVKHFQIINVAVSEDIYQKFEEIRGLLAHKKLSREEIFDRVFDIAIERLRIKRFHVTSKEPPKDSETRYVPAGLVKAVFERDKVCQ